MKKKKRIKKKGKVKIAKKQIKPKIIKKKKVLIKASAKPILPIKNKVLVKDKPVEPYKSQIKSKSRPLQPFLIIILFVGTGLMIFSFLKYNLTHPFSIIGAILIIFSLIELKRHFTPHKKGVIPLEKHIRIDTISKKTPIVKKSKLPKKITVFKKLTFVLLLISIIAAIFYIIQKLAPSKKPIVFPSLDSIQLPTNNIILQIVIILILLFIAIMIVLKVLKKSKKQGKLQEFISNALRKGYSPKEIKEGLKAKNWPHKHIDEAIKKVNKEVTKDPVIIKKGIRALKGYETELDLVLELINKYKSIPVSELATTFNISKELAENWAEILKENNLIDIYYPPFGEIILKALPEKTKEENE